jgi:hypothetical protein
VSPDAQVLPLDRDADWPSLVQAADYQAAPALEEKKPIAIQDIVDLYIEYQVSRRATLYSQEVVATQQ